MASDGSLLFDTGLDNSGFSKGIAGLKTAAVAAAAAITVAFSTAAAAAINVGTSYTTAMSQVSATMGITRASEDYSLLAASAEEMGAKTKYSATQAGEALNYLALAGYNAEKAVSALPTVLNVAAAGGIDLAYSSDMITDSMSALGLGMNELEGFADKLAKTSQKSNTSISQLGEAILTVGGTAKTLSGGVTELNTMLGLIADNGIKGAEGGTALRTMILSLSAPTDTA
ncbi:MAG: phage tail tape measure protein, partial [Oscillospiraceae bacterium]|nr:phage tail tape measure protein [Oscillospiraceae bacterium]